nr:MAG TPA: hypothetical protein [Caudoviricetes sp.]
MVIVYTVNTVKSISFTNFYRISEWRSFCVFLTTKRVA